MPPRTPPGPARFRPPHSHRASRRPGPLPAIASRRYLHQRDEAVTPHRGHDSGEAVAGALAGDGLLPAPLREQASHLTLRDQAMAAAGPRGAKLPGPLPPPEGLHPDAEDPRRLPDPEPFGHGDRV